MFLPVVRSDRMEPRSRWTRYPDTRDEAFEYFRNKGFQARRVQSLCNIAYPKFTRTVVSEIFSAKAVGFDLVLLCFLPTIAAAERGKHRVVLSDGRKNSLSCIFFVGAESGAGKGLALEESLAFFSHWEEAEIQKIQAENARRTDENDLIKARIKVLRKQYAKKPTVETKNLILAEKSKLKDMLPFPHLLQNDVTAASYTQELVKHNIAIRLESDGIILPDSTMRIVNKAWSGENSRRTRISMPDGVFREPFIVDFVAIQPDFFHRYISDPKAVESGRLARTLVYLYDANSFTPNQPAHEMEQQIRNIFHGKLEDLLHYSETSSEKTSILLDPEAESLFLILSMHGTINANLVDHCIGSRTLGNAWRNMRSAWLVSCILQKMKLDHRPISPLKQCRLRSI